MTERMRFSIAPPVLAVAALVLMAAAAGVTYLVLRAGGGDRGGNAARGPAVPEGRSADQSRAATASTPATEVAVVLAPEAVERAGLRLAPAATSPSSATLRLPATIEPDAYRQVSVTPLTAGRVTRVLVELGDSVRRGQTLAEVFSPELAEAHTQYATATAELDAHERELERTQRLVEIGAASRQELERVHAEHTAQVAGVQSARSRLELLGVEPPALERPIAASGRTRATTHVPAPIDGVVVDRIANAGLNVGAADPLFTIVDLSRVWVIAAVNEKDLARVRVGMPATVTTGAHPDVELSGRVSYIDPRLEPGTRTAGVRVEVANPRGELRLGMYADVEIAGGATAAVSSVPREAVQIVGDRHVVYVADPGQPGRFVERPVVPGQASGDRVDVTAGLQPGDRIVTEGSFFLRAEIERLGLRQTSAAGSPPDEPHAKERQRADARVQTAKITVGEQGFEPPKLVLRAGVPARLTFLRTTDKTCGTEVVFPKLKLTRELPLNRPVVVEITPQAGELTFACGMDMLRGTIVAR